MSDQKIVLFEKGSSGLQAFYGFVSEAYNAQLYWPAVAPLYAKLRRSCPEIVMVRNSFTSWARNVSIAVDLPDDATDDDKKYQEFIYQTFDDMEGGSASFIDTMINHVPFDGWGWWEVLPGVRSEKWRSPDENDEWVSEYNDNLVGVRRLAFRDPSTFSGWDMDDRKRLLGMKQRDTLAAEVTIPLSNSLHITYGDPNNPEGLSPLESVWRLERIRNGLEIINGIGFEHSAGYLSVSSTVEGAKFSSDDLAMIKAAARAIMTAQEGNYATWPFGISGEVKDITFSSAATLLENIKYYSILILSVYTMQWMALNTMTSTGALASATDSSQMGVFTFNAMMDGFASQIDAQIGKRLYKWNRDRFPKITKRPKIGFTAIDKNIPLTDLGEFINKFGSLFQFSDDDIKAIRKRSGFLSETMPKTEEPAKKPDKPLGNNPDNIEPNSPDDTPDDQAQATAARTRNLLEMAKNVYRKGGK